jgi:hypothetical protein
MQLGLNLGFSPSRKGSGSGGSSGLQGVKFWTFKGEFGGTEGKTATIIFNYSNGLLVDWGDGTSRQASPSMQFSTKVLGQSSGITLYSTGLITAINRTASLGVPSLGGDVDASNLPNLTVLSINNSSISSITGYEKSTVLQVVSFVNNLLSTTLTLPPSLSLMTSLTQFSCQSSNITGTLPTLTGLNNLLVFRCQNNQFTGSIPSLDNLNSLQLFTCNNNQLTGSMPDLSGRAALQTFDCSYNNLTGPMSGLANMTSLSVFSCNDNQLSGGISSLAGRNFLAIVNAQNNKFTGQGGATVPAALDIYRAENNLLGVADVNKILSLFVAANRTTGSRILNIGGTGNAAPTGQGLTDKATLISRGWTVTTN